MKKIIIAQGILESVGGVESLFGRGGITVFCAATSEEIYSLHRERKVDLIITDLGLPVMGGVELIKKVRGDERLKGVSIILVCDGSETALALCKKAGGNAVIGRPVEAADLFARVSDLIIVPQRKNMRVLLRVSVEDEQGGGSPVFATSENISISGMLIEANHPYRTGDRVLCRFHIGHSEVQVEGRVVRAAKTDAGRYRCGIQFVNLKTKALIVIEQFVKSRRGASLRM